MVCRVLVPGRWIWVTMDDWKFPTNIAVPSPKKSIPRVSVTPLILSPLTVWFVAVLMTVIAVPLNADT
jgi:hypothetical protein